MTWDRVMMAAVALLPLAASPAAAQAPTSAEQVEREVRRVALTDSLWPGFDPLAVPLAIYDGQQTWLFRHPSPPPPFAAVPGSDLGAFAMPGREAAVTSNSSAEIGKTATATLLIDGPRANRTPLELAATAIHEAFHVYQRAHHPGWVGNEGDLLTYPVDNADLLALRRMESEALRRALANQEPAGAACWAAAALAFRRDRFAAMDSAYSAYERLTELNEGLATYVQLRAAGAATVEMPQGEFLAEGVRLRAYTVGPALASLLDRLAPAWRQEVEATGGPALDVRLGQAVQATAAGSACALTPVEATDLRRRARLDAAEVRAGWAARARAFDSLPGWRVLVQSAAGKPLWPQGFDPLNVVRTDDGLIHTRFLRLGNDNGQLTALDEAGADIEAHTVPAGAHPLFNGIAWVEVVLPVRPVVSRSAQSLTIKGPGFTADFRDAKVEESGPQIIVQLTGPAPRE